jgi:hypothetical protein
VGLWKPPLAGPTMRLNELGNIEFQDCRTTAFRAATESNVEGVAWRIEFFVSSRRFPVISSNESSRFVVIKNICLTRPDVRRAFQPKFIAAFAEAKRNGAVLPSRRRCFDASAKPKLLLELNLHRRSSGKRCL